MSETPTPDAVDTGSPPRGVPGVMNASVRRAVADDTSEVAAVHVKAWQWAYHGLLPVSVLYGMSAGHREGTWRKMIIAGQASRSSVWVAERSGRIVGFTVTGVPQDAGYSTDTAEVLAIYQLEEVSQTGVACRMMVRALDDLRARGFRLAILWVLESNARARRFYERGGWRPDGAARTDRLGRFVVHQVRYYLDLASTPWPTIPSSPYRV